MRVVRLRSLTSLAYGKQLDFEDIYTEVLQRSQTGISAMQKKISAKVKSLVPAKVGDKVSAIVARS